MFSFIVSPHCWIKPSYRPQETLRLRVMQHMTAQTLINLTSYRPAVAYKQQREYWQPCWAWWEHRPGIGIQIRLVELRTNRNKSIKLCQQNTKQTQATAAYWDGRPPRPSSDYKIWWIALRLTLQVLWWRVLQPFFSSNYDTTVWWQVVHTLHDPSFKSCVAWTRPYLQCRCSDLGSPSWFPSC